MVQTISPLSFLILTDTGSKSSSIMPDKAVYLLVVDGFADWEAAHAIAELRRHGGYRVVSVGLTRDPVISMGGLRVLPSCTVEEIDPKEVAVFILPGGDRWETEPMESELASALKRLDAQTVPIAAICAATVAIARIGLLRGRRHTSNGLKYLQSHVPEYREAGNYVEAPAVRDRGLITASGLADVEFARELFEELGVLSANDRAVWADIFRNARLPDETGA
jgi:putative intracellular protease/amidase